MEDLYDVEITLEAGRDITELKSRRLIQEALDEIEELAIDPYGRSEDMEPGYYRSVHFHDNKYRIVIRIWKYNVTVLRVGPREEVYKGLEKRKP